MDFYIDIRSADESYSERMKVCDYVPGNTVLEDVMLTEIRSILERIAQAGAHAA